MDRDELILQKLSELSTDLKQVRKDVTDIKLQQSEDRRQSETAILKLDGDLQRVKSKLTGDLQRVESKIDGVVTDISERKADTNERWEIGGIIISIFLAISVFTKVSSFPKVSSEI